MDGRGTNFEEVKQRWASSFAADGHDLYPWGLELRPIWEVVERIDATKGKALKDYLMQKWQRQARAFSPVNFYTPFPGRLRSEARPSGAGQSSTASTRGWMASSATASPSTKRVWASTCSSRLAARHSGG